MFRTSIIFVFVSAVLASAACKSDSPDGSSATGATPAAPHAKPTDAPMATTPPTAAPPPTHAQPSALTCLQLVTHLTDVDAPMGGEMFPKADIEPLTARCEAEGTVEKHAAGLKCVMQASTGKQVKACKPSLMSMIDDW